MLQNTGFGVVGGREELFMPRRRKGLVLILIVLDHLIMLSKLLPIIESYIGLNPYTPWFVTHEPKPTLK
jgi:hypothetical protein